MNCIYCQQPSDSTTARAHIFPEAIVQNDRVLPLGAECARCNNVLGDVDRAVTQHPFVAFAIQFLGLPGKKGRKRAEIANVSRTVQEGWITIPCAEPSIRGLPDGRREATIQPLIHAAFDSWKFRRGLHHIAFNVLADWKGVEHAQRSEYDAVRRYVRFPTGRSEQWPYVQLDSLLTRIREDVSAEGHDAALPELIMLRIFNSDFWVDVRNSGELLPWAWAHLPPTAHLVDASYAFPKPSKQGKRRYRVRVEVERKGAAAGGWCSCGSGMRFPLCHGR